mgnify:CR=1 FL=1
MNIRCFRIPYKNINKGNVQKQIHNQVISVEYYSRHTKFNLTCSLFQLISNNHLDLSFQNFLQGTRALVIVIYVSLIIKIYFSWTCLLFESAAQLSRLAHGPLQLTDILQTDYWIDYLRDRQMFWNDAICEIKLLKVMIFKNVFIKICDSN